jgi:hypothetical protein
MTRKPLTLIVIVLALAATTVACTSRDLAESDCLDGDRPIYVVPAHGTPWPSSRLSLPNGTTIDARGDDFDGSTINAGGWSTSIKIHRQDNVRSDLCFVGGRIYSTIDPVNTLFEVWHDSAGVRAETADLHFVGSQLANVGDGFQFGTTATDWRLTGIRADGQGALPGASVHDDCIENDAMNSGLVEDSKFDGCHVFMSSMGWGHDGTSQTVTVRDSLVRLQPMYNSFNPVKYGHNQHGGFFKWSMSASTDGIPPNLVIDNVTFRADQVAKYGGNINGWLALPPNTDCGSVTLVGTASWQPRDIASFVNQCDSVTFGSVADWNASVAAWDAEHPVMLPGS